MEDLAVASSSPASQQPLFGSAGAHVSTLLLKELSSKKGAEETHCLIDLHKHLTMRLQVSAQFPIFAVLEKHIEEVYEGKVDIKVHSTAVALNESQLSILSAFIAALPKVPHHSKGQSYALWVCQLCFRAFCSQEFRMA